VPVAATADAAAATADGPRTHRWFGALFVSYTLEGIGYIVAGTFLVAAIGQGSPGWIGSGAWGLAGLAAVPSSALWERLGQRWSRPGLPLTALVHPGGRHRAARPDRRSRGRAGLCGVVRRHVHRRQHPRPGRRSPSAFPRSVALLTAGYSVGQILGPLAVAPLPHHGYRQALLLAAVVVLAAAAAVTRIGFP
jgi:hypothetical protein